MLRAYLGIRSKNVFLERDRVDLSAGRITLDVGSRRFVARNQFRNTINGFTVVQGIWVNSQGAIVQAFYTFPINCEPGESQKLVRNSNELDDESFETRFWGVHVSDKELWTSLHAEIYVFGLHENDRPGVATRNRNLYTPSARLVKEAHPGNYDYGLEVALQFGTSLSSTTTANTTDLNHRARFFMPMRLELWTSRGHHVLSYNMIMRAEILTRMILTIVDSIPYLAQGDSNLGRRVFMVLLTAATSIHLVFG